jgi:PEP-CTERM motif
MSSRILRRIACVTIALGIGVLWMPSSANANMRMELATPTVANTYVGAILTDTGNTGQLTFNNPVGGFNINVATGTSFPPNPVPGGNAGMLDLNSVNVAFSSAGSITIILENSSYNAPTGSLNAAIGAIGGTITNGTVTATSYVDATNSTPLFSADQGVGALPSGQPAAMPGSGIQDLSFTSSAAAFSTSFSTPITSSGTFSMYEKLVITFGAGGGVFSADLSNTVTPEPSSLAIAGIGALGMIGYGLRRRKALGA